MTVFEIECGERVAVESLRGNVVTGRVTDRRVVDHRKHVTVQVAENVSIERPVSEVTHP